MAFSLRAASKFTKTVTVDYDGQTVTLDYKPSNTSFEEKLELEPKRRKILYDLAEANRMLAHFENRRENALLLLESKETAQADTEALVAAVATLKAEADKWNSVAEQLYKQTEMLDVEEVCRLVERWDVLDEDDRLMPTDDPKQVAKLPGKLLELILKAIDEDSKPNPPSAPPSSTTSSPEASAATAPTGT